MASPSTSKKIDEVEVVQERDYVESETSSKYNISRTLKCQVCSLNTHSIINILHNGISSELRSPVNVDAENLSSCLHSARMHFFGRNIFSLTHELI